MYKYFLLSIFIFSLACTNPSTKNNSQKVPRIQIKIEEMVIDTAGLQNVVLEIVSGLKKNPSLINKYIRSDSGCIISFCNGAMPTIKTDYSFAALEKTIAVKPLIFTPDLKIQFYWKAWPKVNCDKPNNYETEGIFITSIDQKNLPASFELAEMKTKQKILNLIALKNTFAVLLTPGLKFYIEKTGNVYYLKMIDFCFPCSA